LDEVTKMALTADTRPRIASGVRAPSFGHGGRHATARVSGLGLAPGPHGSRDGASAVRLTHSTILPPCPTEDGRDARSLSGGLRVPAQPLRRGRRSDADAGE
jgi:hypothetical protein